MNKQKLTHLAQSLPASVPFVGPEAQERKRGAPFTARLGANENVFGPSPLAIKAMQTSVAETWMYGDPESHDLRTALAKLHKISPENIMLGEGIDALLGYLVRLLVEPGDRVVTSAGAYPTFNYHVAGYGGALVTIPYQDDHEDPVGLMAKARDVGAKLIYLANPDNPMGTWQSGQTIADAIAEIPDNCLLVLDEAYLEFAPKDTSPAIDPDDPRVIRMRTFSKAYGMAGARVGYAIGHPGMITAFNKVRNHFGMCRISQIGALAALGDQKYLAEVTANVANARLRIGQIARENGLNALPSAANFVAIDCGKDAAFATAVLNGLIQQGIFVRMPFSEPQNRCIRVSAGTNTQLNAFAAALPIAIEIANTAS